MDYKVWGKSKNENKEISLSEHINDVLRVFQCLKEKVKQKELIELIEIVIAYHDAGKILPYFQRKTLKNIHYKPFEVYTNIPHSIFSALLVDKEVLKEQLSSLFNEDEVKAETYSRYVLSAIAYHHWRDNFFDIVEGNTDVFDRLSKLIADETKWKKIEENLANVYSSIEEEKDNSILKINRKWLEGLNNGIRFADYVIPPYLLYRMPKRIEIESSQLKDWILISGFTMLSDHFASYMESESEENMDVENVEIEGIGFNEIKSNIEEELKQKIQGYNSSKIWQFNNVDEYKGHNTILLAPTGMGKTEFSYLWSNGEKFFYTLPLRTAVNQIFNRTQKIFGKDKSGILHSDADVYLLGDGGESDSMRIYELAKKMSYPAIISTGDQFFPYGLRPPAYEKIFAKFSYSRLIIDEIQAYDPKAAAIVVKFMEHIVQMGGRFLLMTATIPVFIQKEIDRRIGEEYKTLNLFEKDAELTQFSKHKIKMLVEEYKEEQQSYSKERLQTIVNKAMENGGSRVLVVLNTVKQAQNVFSNLRKIAGEKVDIKLFHSRFTQSHRKEKENDLDKFIGNNDDSRNDKRAKILVATQVVEASLDLDADFLYTELAPWDSLIQRMGRVFRQAHPKSNNVQELSKVRYSNSEIPNNVFIITYNGKDKKGKNVYESGKGYVYNDELLRITLRLVENGSIPKYNDIEKEKTEYKKWLEKSKIDFKKIEKVNILIAESDKNSLVQLLFELLPSDGKYLKNFYGMLQILDAGFMSDRKSEAQKVFREINDIQVISTHQKENLIKDLKSFSYDKKYAYSCFKRDILSKYVMNIQLSKVKEYITETYHVPYYIRINEDIEDNKILSKLSNWLNGIYFVELDYLEQEGLVGINEFKTEDLFL